MFRVDIAEEHKASPKRALKVSDLCSVFECLCGCLCNCNCLSEEVDQAN